MYQLCVSFRYMNVSIKFKWSSELGFLKFWKFTLSWSSFTTVIVAYGGFNPRIRKSYQYCMEACASRSYKRAVPLHRSSACDSLTLAFFCCLPLNRCNLLLLKYSASTLSIRSNDRWVKLLYATGWFRKVNWQIFVITLSCINRLLKFFHGHAQK